MVVFSSNEFGHIFVDFVERTDKVVGLLDSQKQVLLGPQVYHTRTLIIFQTCNKIYCHSDVCGKASHERLGTGSCPAIISNPALA